MEPSQYRAQPPGGYATRDHPPDHTDSLPPGSFLHQEQKMNYVYKPTMCVACDATPSFEDSAYCEECAKELL
jgi:hypothetical protein